MKGLENYFALSSRLTVYVPSTIKVNKTRDNSKIVNAVASLLSGFFGGATSTPAVGYWNSSDCGLVKEKTTMVFAYCTEVKLEEHLPSIVEYCQNMKRELEQESIALELNGKMYFL